MQGGPECDGGPIIWRMSTPCTTAVQGGVQSSTTRGASSNRWHPAPLNFASTTITRRVSPQMADPLRTNIKRGYVPLTRAGPPPLWMKDRCAFVAAGNTM